MSSCFNSKYILNGKLTSNNDIDDNDDDDDDDDDDGDDDGKETLIAPPITCLNL